MTENEETGLRERKKLRTRRAIALATLDLSMQHGIEAVTVDQIAALADVSPRTFNNYFSCKEEAICSLAADRAGRMGDSLIQRPKKETLSIAIRAVIVDEYGSADERPNDGWLKALHTVISTPSVRGEYLKTREIMRRSLAGGISRRVPAADELAADVVAAAIIATVDFVLEAWLLAGGKSKLLPALEAALDRVTPAFSKLIKVRPLR